MQALWTKDCKEAFTQLKKSLCASPILKSPEFTQPFHHADRCLRERCWAVLSQLDQSGEEHPVAFFSQKLLQQEEAYSTVEECLTIKLLQAFHVYLLAGPFVMQTDHQSMVWLDRIFAAIPVCHRVQVWVIFRPSNFLSSWQIVQFSSNSLMNFVVF